MTRHCFMKSDRQLMSMNKRQFSRQIEKGKLVDFDFFIRLARGALGLELKCDAAEVVGADIVDDDNDGGGDGAGGRCPEGCRCQDLDRSVRVGFR